MSRRVGFVSHYWAPHVGGVETMAAEYATRLAGRGWGVSIATSRLTGDSGTERHGGVRIDRYPCWNVLEDRLRVPVPLMSPTMLRGLRAAATDLDVMAAHGHAYVGSLYAALAARATRLPFVLIQANPFVDYRHPVDWLEHLVDRTVGRFVIEQAVAVVCISRFTESYVRKIAPRARTTVVHPGVDTTRFFPRATSRVAPPRRRLRVLTVRRLVPRNGVDLLVRAWRGIGLDGSAELVIAGEGPETAAIGELAREDPSISMRGFVDDGELADLYRSSDLFVLPTRSGEGFGLAAAEALACGVPVVATDSGGVSEFVSDGVNGRIVAPGDGDALGAALADLLLDPARLAALTENARLGASGGSWEAATTALEKVLDEVIETRWSPESPGGR